MALENLFHDFRYAIMRDNDAVGKSELKFKNEFLSFLVGDIKVLKAVKQT